MSTAHVLSHVQHCLNLTEEFKKCANFGCEFAQFLLHGTVLTWDGVASLNEFNGGWSKVKFEALSTNSKNVPQACKMMICLQLNMLYILFPIKTISSSPSSLGHLEPNIKQFISIRLETGCFPINIHIYISIYNSGFSFIVSHGQMEVHS